MKKKTKIIVGIFVTFILLVVAVLGYAGNYLYDLAINPNTDKSAVFENESTKNDTPFVTSTDSILEQSNELTMDSKDGLSLHAYEVTQDSNQWVIAVHGYSGQASDMSNTARQFYNRGFNVLMPDLRGHGKSEGNYIGMGWDDRQDIVQWIDMLIKEHPDAKIVLYGISMGAATVINTVGEELPDNVVLAIEDCGYTSTWDIFAYQLKSMFSLPSHPFLDAANIITYIRAGYTFNKGPIEQIEKCKIPMLLIHGSKDNFVPSDMIYKLYDKATCPKDMLVVEGAGHGQSKDVAPLVYWDKIDAFLKQYLTEKS